MARKGWDALSNAYRERLIRGGVDKAGYDAGMPLQGARGHMTAGKEQWMKDSNKFAHETVWHSGKDSRLTVDRVRREVRSMGKQRGSRHISEQRRMIRLYERGETEAARALWEQRDTSLPDYFYFYHGVFAY